MTHTYTIEFPDNRLLPQVFGEKNANIASIETNMMVKIHTRGNVVQISGDEEQVNKARDVLENLYDRVKNGEEISEGGLGGMMRNGHSDRKDDYGISIRTPRRTIRPFTNVQAEYLRALSKHAVTFGSGPAGTGKTYLAVAIAVSMFVENKVDRIILSRPAVEAGESLGFLPGDLKDKVDPYLRPLYDALYDMLPAEKVVRYIETGQIEIAPLAYMRGRTLRNAFVILDEAQNTNAVQMKMFLTRLGEGTKMAINGDLSQTDLPKGMKSGLRDALEKMEGIEEIASIKFLDKDSVRHPLTMKIIRAYEAHDDGNRWDGKRK